MPGIPRKTAQIFASSAAPSGAISTFGSLKSGAVAYSNDPAAIQTPAWLNGLAAALIGNKSPTWQDLNGILLVLSQQIAYLAERGIPEYDAGTTYNTNDVCRIGRVIYTSNVDANLGNNPATSSAQWANLLSGSTAPSLSLAWALFDGTQTDGFGNARLLNGSNVSTVSRTAAGCYVVNFATALPSGNYGFTGSAGTQNGQSPAPGDNNVIVGGPAGQTIIRTKNACSVFCREPTQTPGLEDSSCIFVVFFGS